MQGNLPLPALNPVAVETLQVSKHSGSGHGRVPSPLDSKPPASSSSGLPMHCPLCPEHAPCLGPSSGDRPPRSHRSTPSPNRSPPPSSRLPPPCPGGAVRARGTSTVDKATRHHPRSRSLRGRPGSVTDGGEGTEARRGRPGEPFRPELPGPGGWLWPAWRLTATSAPPPLPGVDPEGSPRKPCTKPHREPPCSSCKSRASPGCTCGWLSALHKFLYVTYAVLAVFKSTASDLPSRRWCELITAHGHCGHRCCG